MQKKRGRPAKYGKAMKDYYIRLAESHAETFRKAGKDAAGKDNMSAGARRLADEWEDREMRSRNGTEGMTLIELLVVVGVCAILAAMAMGIYSHCKEPAKDQALREHIHQVRVAALAEDPTQAHIPSTNGCSTEFAEMKRSRPRDIESAVYRAYRFDAYSSPLSH